MDRRSKILKKVEKILLIIFMVLLVITVGLAIYCYCFLDSKADIKPKKKVNVLDYYSEYALTSKDTDLYILKDNKYVKVGTISKDIYLNLEKSNDKYFLITNIDGEYYIKYNSIKKSDEEKEVDSRYKNYIVFNKNVKTSSKTSFYDEDRNLIYSVEKDINLPIIYMDDKYLGVSVKDRLLYIKKEDGVTVVDNKNTDDKNTKGIGVLNYHFFYDDSIDGELAKCNQDICQSTTLLKEQLNYIRDNNYFTPTMKELEMYIDGKIQLPKSVVITIDDGWRAAIGTKIITEYKMNATVFVITGTYKAEEFKNDYIEVHSHSDNMHNTGDCPTGQGGGIQCLSEEKVLADLKTSSEKLGGSTVFCYPFYEYNSYAISMLKKAGYTMAFAGENRGSNNIAYVGIDKYKIPRFVMVNYTTINDLARYLQGNYYS